MSVARVTEIIAASDQSFDHAVTEGVARACRTLKNVQGAWVKEMSAKVQQDRIVEYRVTLKITFVLED